MCPCKRKMHKSITVSVIKPMMNPSFQEQEIKAAANLINVQLMKIHDDEYIPPWKTRREGQLQIRQSNPSLQDLSCRTACIHMKQRPQHVTYVSPVLINWQCCLVACQVFAETWLRRK